MRSRLRELAAVRRRFGWRGCTCTPSRDSVHVNHKKLRRLYTEERLQPVRQADDRKRRPWAPRTDGPPAGPEPTLVAHCRRRHADRRTPVSGSWRRSTTQPGVPIAWWPTRRCRARRWLTPCTLSSHAEACRSAASPTTAASVTSFLSRYPALVAGQSRGLSSIVSRPSRLQTTPSRELQRSTARLELLNETTVHLARSNARVAARGMASRLQHRAPALARSAFNL